MPTFGRDIVHDLRIWKKCIGPSVSCQHTLKMHDNHHILLVNCQAVRLYTSLPLTPDPSPLSRMLHRRAEFHPLLLSYSSPQCISPQDPIVIHYTGKDEVRFLGWLVNGTDVPI